MGVPEHRMRVNRAAEDWYQSHDAPFSERASARLRFERELDKYAAALQRGAVSVGERQAVDALERISALLEADMPRGPFMVRLEEVVADALAIARGAVATDAALSHSAFVSHPVSDSRAADEERNDG